MRYGSQCCGASEPLNPTLGLQPGVSAPPQRRKNIVWHEEQSIRGQWF